MNETQMPQTNVARAETGKVSRHFVTFYSPGTFVHEESEKPIDSWSVEKAVKLSRGIVERYGAKPFAFQFSTRGRSATDLDSKVIVESGWYYLGGKVMTLADVEREMPDSTILISNMKANDIKRVVVNDNSWRSVNPLRDNDTVLDMKLFK